MYNTAPAFRTLMAEPSRTLSARGLVIYPDLAQQALTAAQISSFAITENAGDHLPLGTAGASTLTLKLDNRNGEWEQGGSIRGNHKIEGAEVQLELGVWNGTAYLWENIGRYILENARGQEQETLITFKGMDYLGNKAQRAFIDDLAYPMTLAAMADLACFQAGFTRKSGAFLNSTVTISTRPDWPGDISCRDALAYIAQAAGGFARIDRNGQLEIVTLPKTANVTLAPDRYKTLTRQAETFTLNAVIFEGREASEDSPAIEPSRVATVPGMADNVLNSTSVINPLLLPGKYNALKTPLTNALLGLSFIGAELKWQGDPTVTCGDCVEVTDLAGAKQKVIIAHNELSFTPGFEMTSGNQLANDAQAGTDSSKERIFTPGGKLNAAAIDGKIQRAQIGIAAIGEAQIDDLSVTTAKMKDAAITNAKIENLAVDNAKIANAGIDYAKIKDLSTDTAIIQDGIGNRLVIGRLIVTDANLEAAIVGKLVIRDTDGRFYRISINSSTGAVTASQVQMNGDSLTDNAVTSVSQRMLWRQATAPASPWVGMLWQDTTNDQLKRCTGTSPVAWEIIPAGAVHTSVIDVDDNGMIVASTGTLSLLSGSTLEIKNLGNTANIIKLDNTGMKLGSTGKIQLDSTEQVEIGFDGDTLASFTQGEINLAVSDIQVGGTNLLLNSDFSQGETVAWGAGGGLSSNQMFHGKKSLQLPSTTTVVNKNQVVSGMVAPGETVTLSINVLTPFSSQYNANNGKTIALLRFRDAGNSGLVERTITLPGTFTNQWQRLSVTYTAPAGTASVLVRLISNDNAGVSSYLHFAEIKLEKGNKATDWSPAPEDPASGAQTTYMKMLNDLFEVYSGGSVNIFAGSDFNVRAGKQAKHLGISNNEADGFMLWAGSQTPATAPFSVTMDGTLTATNLDGSFTVSPENGGTGFNRQTIYRGTTAPPSVAGSQDGDLYVFYNGPGATGWSAQTLTYSSAGVATRYGITKNWNEVPTGSLRRIGNGVGANNSYRWGATASFTSPSIATRTLTFTFTTAKNYSGTWYGYSGTTEYMAVLAKGTGVSDVIATTIFTAGNNSTSQEITLTASSNLTQSSTHYIGIFYNGATEKTGAVIVGNITMKANSGYAGRTYDLYIKSAGQWYALIGNG